MTTTFSFLARMVICGWSRVRSEPCLLPASRSMPTFGPLRHWGSSASFGFLGMDGNLWLEFSPFGTVPPSRVLIDSNVLAMQPLDINDVIVLRTDGTLWLEQGSSASTPVTRTQI